MAKIGLFYGSDWGNTEKVAFLIQKAFGKDLIEVFNVGRGTGKEIVRYKKIILGVSTSEGHGLQRDWRIFYPRLDEMSFEGKTVALFGLGNQKEFPDHFVDAMGILSDKVRERGAAIIGSWPREGYQFLASEALSGDQFVGLVIDEDNQPDLTDSRVTHWVKQIKKKFIGR